MAGLQHARERQLVERVTKGLAGEEHVDTMGASKSSVVKISITTARIHEQTAHRCKLSGTTWLPV